MSTKTTRVRAQRAMECAWERDAGMSTHPFAMRHERKCSRAAAPCTLPGLGRLTISARQTRSMSWIGKVLDEQPGSRVSRRRSSSERRSCGLRTPIVSSGNSAQPVLLLNTNASNKHRSAHARIRVLCHVVVVFCLIDVVGPLLLWLLLLLLLLLWLLLLCCVVLLLLLLCCVVLCCVLCVVCCVLCCDSLMCCDSL